MKKPPQVDLLLDKYQRFLTLITKEQEQLALSRDETKGDDFEIRIPITKKMVKRFIKYYNLSCLYEYLDDGVTFRKGKEHDEYYKELCKVYVAMQRLKDNFYKEMHRNFLNHNIALFEWEDESLGESETDLMTMWADDIQTQVMETVKNNN